MAIVDNTVIQQELAEPIESSPSRVRDILSRARELKGLSRQDVLTLLNVESEDMLGDIFETARWVKGEIYGRRLVLFAPLYVSNLCKNNCLYCAFRSGNPEVVRKALNQEEIREEVEILLAQGHKRVLLVSGEAYPGEGLSYILRSIETIYSVHTSDGNIRRVNVNIAPLSVEEFRELLGYTIGTYQLFQETYHEPTYRKLHTSGPKADYRYRLETMDRGFEAGLNDAGIGLLFGLYDWRYEILALMQHIEHLEQTFGLGPHTISVPRLEPALGSGLSDHPPCPVSDIDFKKIIAILRLAVPYTGIILSTRESARMRRAAFELGVSQISAGSRTNPGGYKHEDLNNPDRPLGKESQFSLGDTRPLREVIGDMVSHGYIPSFCTACYRLGRVGADFMDLAKPGLIKDYCLPNALVSFAEYLYDFADETLQRDGFRMIEGMIGSDIQQEGMKEKVRSVLERMKKGERDLYF